METMFYNAVMSVKDSINSKKAHIVKLEWQFEQEEDKKEMRRLINEIGRKQEEIDTLIAEYKEGFALL